MSFSGTSTLSIVTSWLASTSCCGPSTAPPTPALTFFGNLLGAPFCAGGCIASETTAGLDRLGGSIRCPVPLTPSNGRSLAANGTTDVTGVGVELSAAPTASFDAVAAAAPTTVPPFVGSCC